MSRSILAIIRRVSCCAALVLGLCVGGALPGHADDSLGSITPFIIGSLRDSAGQLRQQADEELKRAKQWHDLAAQCRQYASQTTDQEFIDSWNRDAAYNDRQAAALEQSAAELKARADDQEARAVRLEQAMQAPAAASGSSSSPPPAETSARSAAEELALQAQWQRSRASDLKTLAQRWRGAAQDMRAQVAGAGTRARKAALEETANLYDNQAAALDINAKIAEDAATKLENTAKVLPPDYRKPQADKTPMVPPGAFEGTWMAEGSEATGGDQIVIRQTGSGSVLGFTLDSRRYHWNGLYDTDPQPRNGRLWFWLRPEIRSMNLDIPQWARQQVASDMEWRLSFDTDEYCGTNEITGTWYPGEVTWDEGARKAWVTGQGKPIVIKYKRVPEPPEEASGTPSVFVVTPVKSGEDFAPLRTLPRGVPFRIKAVLPSNLGDDAGHEITAKIAGSGGTLNVELTGNPTPAGPWIYVSHPIEFQPYLGIDERVIRRVLDGLSTDTYGVIPSDIWRDAAANEIKWKTTDGESLSVTLLVTMAGAPISFDVYEDMVSFNKYQIRARLNEYEIPLRTALLLNAGGGATAASERKLAMILNARTFLDYEPETILNSQASLAYRPGVVDIWPSQMPVAIGLQYLRILRMSDEIHSNTSTLSDAPNAQGVVFQSMAEKDFVETRIGEVRDKSVSAYFSDLADRLKAHFDEKKAINHYLPFDVEDLKVAVKGEDWEGQPVDTLTRVLAGTRLTLQIFVEVAGAYETVEGLGMLRAGTLAAEGAELAGSGAAGGANALEAEVMEGRSEILRLQEPNNGRFPVDAAKTPTRASLIEEGYARKIGTTEFDVIASQAALDAGVASGTCVKGGCSLAGMSFTLGDRGIAKIASDTLHYLLSRNFGLNVLEQGFDFKIMRDILEGLYGAKTFFSTALKKLPWDVMEVRFTQGYQYFAKIKYLGSDFLHTVVITGVERGGGIKNQITKVIFFDVNASAEIRMSCSQFQELFLNSSTAKEKADRVSTIMGVTFK